jgi:Kdo2-lipid IVA lauroyltransferase/acyltransferase
VLSVPDSHPVAATAPPRVDAPAREHRVPCFDGLAPARRIRRGRPIPWHKRLRRNIRGAWIGFGLLLLGLLPMRLAVAVGRAGGVIAYCLIWPQRRLAMQHLRIAFPDLAPAEHRKLAIEAFRHLGWSVAECAKSRFVRRRIEELVELPERDRAVLRDALAENRGAVLVSGHIGNWELLGQRLAVEAPVTVVARELNASLLNYMVERYRLAGKVRTLWRGSPNVLREMLRVFRDNGMLGLLIDQDTKVRSIFVPFFGRAASTPSAAGDLCVRTGAPLLATFIHRRPHGRHVISVERIRVDLSGDSETDSRNLTAAATAAIEQAIRQHPAQWVWLHRRWRTQPPVG